MGLGMYELFVKFRSCGNEHLPLYKKEYNGTEQILK